ncbi:MAG: 2-phospho-L-lactate guanylyltransferase [Actinomycetota bacterium]|nr:2-phospho-L-lactate guanylyltransferase [Actinomycetota bacterium]
MRALLVPIKAFRFAKLRLAPVMGPEGRAELARELAARVLSSSQTLSTFVACDDGEVADFAISHGAQVLWTPGRGLSGAVGAAVVHLATAGFELVVVAHADLPFVPPLAQFGREGRVTLAPDRQLDGTNVIAVPARSGFRFAYGPDSFHRHLAEAARLGLASEIVRDWRLATDVDHPADVPLVR